MTGTAIARQGTVYRNGRPRPPHYNRRVQPMIVNACTATTGFASVAGCNLSMANVTTPEGLTQSLLKITGTGDNTAAFWDCSTVPFNGPQLGREGVEFDFYYQPGEPYSDLGNSGLTMTVRFFNGSTIAVVATFQIRQGWQKLRIKKAAFASVNGGNWDTTAFTVLRFSLSARANVTHVAWMRNLGYMGQSKPIVCIQFDDNIRDVYQNAFPLMRERGIPGSVAVISDSVGLNNWNGYDRMTVDQMLELKAAGWDFINHTKSHQQGVLPTATQNDCQAEIQGCIDFLRINKLGNGISELIFAAPYGEYGTNYRAAAVACGCVMFRGTVGDATGNNPRIAEADVMYDPLVQVPTMYVTNAQTPASLLDDIDLLIGGGGYHIPLFHATPTSGSADIQYIVSNFTTYLDGLVARQANLIFANSSQTYELTRL